MMRLPLDFLVLAARDYGAPCRLEPQFTCFGSSHGAGGDFRLDRRNDALWTALAVP